MHPDERVWDRAQAYPLPRAFGTEPSEMGPAGPVTHCRWGSQIFPTTLRLHLGLSLGFLPLPFIPVFSSAPHCWMKNEYVFTGHIETDRVNVVFGRQGGLRDELIGQVPFPLSSTLTSEVFMSLKTSDPQPFWHPGWRRSPGGGYGNPLQYSCLDRGAWCTMDHCKESDTTEAT